MADVSVATRKMRLIGCFRARGASAAHLARLRQHLVELTVAEPFPWSREVAAPPAAAPLGAPGIFLPGPHPPGRAPRLAGRLRPGGSPTPASLALHAALPVALASAAMMAGGVAMYGF